MRQTAGVVSAGLMVGAMLAGCGTTASSRSLAVSPTAGASATTVPADASTTALIGTDGSAPPPSAAAPPTSAGPQPTQRPAPAQPPPTTGAPRTPTTATTGSAPGVYGLVTAGPSCPVERQGQSCPPNAVSGARVDAQAADGHVVASARTSANGGYSVVLGPGRYTLVVTTGSAYPRCPATPVTVSAGAASRADISCDSGIR